MTAIAAIKHDTGVTMGGDSAGVGGLRLHVRRDPKVFWCGRLLIGYTSSFRMAQLIRFGLHDALRIEDLAPPDDPDQGFAFMVNDFVPRVRYLFNQGGFTQKDREQEVAGTFMVAWGTQLYLVMDDLQVADVADPYCAVGCGMDLCLGAMHALHGDERHRLTVHRALQAAERFSAGVRAPFVIHDTREPEAST